MSSKTLKRRGTGAESEQMRTGWVAAVLVGLLVAGCTSLSSDDFAAPAPTPIDARVAAVLPTSADAPRGWTLDLTKSSRPNGCASSALASASATFYNGSDVAIEKAYVFGTAKEAENYYDRSWSSACRKSTEGASLLTMKSVGDESRAYRYDPPGGKNATNPGHFGATVRQGPVVVNVITGQNRAHLVAITSTAALAAKGS